MTIISLTDSVSLTLPYAIQDQLLLVNSLNFTLIYDITSICEDDHRSIPSNFDSVFSFVDVSITEPCGCTRDTATTTTAAPDTTTVSTEKMETTTFNIPPVESTLNPTTGTPTSSSPSPEVGLSQEELIIVTVVVTVTILVVGVVIASAVCLVW